MTDKIISPASLLAKVLKDINKTPELIIVSGSSGVGKSAYCLQLAGQATSSGLVVGGVISPAVFVDGHKIAIDLSDLLSGERRRLAFRRNGATAGFRTTNWLIDPEVLAWGDQQLSNLPPCDVVILDELGPLEFSQGQGFQAGLKLIGDRLQPLIIAVIRPTLLPQAQERWPWAELLLMDGER